MELSWCGRFHNIDPQPITHSYFRELKIETQPQRFEFLHQNRRKSYFMSIFHMCPVHHRISIHSRGWLIIKRKVSAASKEVVERLIISIDRYRHLFRKRKYPAFGLLKSTHISPGRPKHRNKHTYGYSHIHTHTHTHTDQSTDRPRHNNIVLALIIFQTDRIAAQPIRLWEMHHVDSNGEAIINNGRIIVLRIIGIEFISEFRLSKMICLSVQASTVFVAWVYRFWRSFSTKS